MIFCKTTFCVGMLLQWISQISFPRLVCITMSSSYSLFPVPFPSFLPSSCNKTFERARQLIHSERITRSSCHGVFISSPDLERICIRANRLSLVQDLPMLHVVLEAAISVSWSYTTGQTRLCTLWSSKYVESITFALLPIWESHNVQHGAGLFSLLLRLSRALSAISSSSDAVGSSHVKYSNGASSSEEVMLQLVVSTPRSGRTSFTWRGVLSTRTECVLYTPVIVPFQNWVVHCPCGILTQTLSPTS